MVVLKSYGGRPIARGQRYLFGVVFGVICLTLVHLYAYELTWSVEQSSVRGSRRGSRRAFNAMLKDYWFAYSNHDGVRKIQLQDSRLAREMMQALSLCETNPGEAGSEKGDNDGVLLKNSLSPGECRMRKLANYSALQQESDQEQEYYSHEKKGFDKRRIGGALENELNTLSDILKNSTVFLELKDTREPGLTITNTNWFMSSIHGPEENDGNTEVFEFPSDLSHGRLLCLKGNSRTDGTQNSYGFAWKGYLPADAKLLPGTTLVADQYWDYQNIWHGMAALASFVSWRGRSGCAVADRVLLYHWGELMPSMSSWVDNLLHASFGKKLEVEMLEHGQGGNESRAPVVCLERAIVQRRGLGKTSLQNLNALFDTIRCRARKYCGVVVPEAARSQAVQVTLFVRTGARAFTNETTAQRVIDKVCEEDGHCHVEVAYSSNLSFCEQVTLKLVVSYRIWDAATKSASVLSPVHEALVALMSRTDVLVTTHGAQLTNSMFMSKGGSIMELIPKGWLDFAGVGQYIYTWLADWCNLHHEGIWRDPVGPDCPYPKKDDRLPCFLFHKDLTVTHNATHLKEWTTEVIGKFRKREETMKRGTTESVCACDGADHMHEGSDPPPSR